MTAIACDMLDRSEQAVVPADAEILAVGDHDDEALEDSLHQLSQDDFPVKRSRLESPVKDDPSLKKRDIDLDTLRKRLAGPSVAKPGQEGVDQDKINRIIYKASLGSKYFNNERKKDEQLTEKIEATLQKAKLIMQSDLSADEHRIDKHIAVLETGIDLSQYIMHIDCDAFYASVEELDKPELKNIPMGVGIGVLTTANYAARKFGIHANSPFVD
jgi:DNA polymerase kappa